MATLKISDLSVGDWVKIDIYPTPYKVQDLAFNGYVWLSERNRVTPIDIIAPIPITAEILEKNGLYRHEYDADNPQMIVLSNHCIMARTYTDVDWWRVIIYDEEFPAEELFNGIICSVHQLQHALRLAGIDKEITL